jgi:endopolyphosphatase
MARLSYNVTGLKLDEDGLIENEEDVAESNISSQTALPSTQKRKTGHRHKKKKKKKKDDCSKPEHEDQPHCKFRRKERHFSPESPSRANTLFTPLGYTQFYLPGVDDQTHSSPKWVIEYATYSPEGLLRGGRNGTDGDAQGRQPVPWHLLPGYHELIEREEAGSLDSSGPSNNRKLKGQDQDDEDPYAKFKAGLKKITPYHMEDLTIPSYAHFAKKLTSQKRLWKRFASAM